MEEEYVDPRIMEQQQMLLQQSQDFLRFQLDVTEELKYLLWDLMGFVYDDDKDEWKRDPTKVQMINQKGANAILTFLRPRVTRIFSLSNHGELDIDQRCLRYINDLTYMLCRHKDEWEIKSYQIMDNIIDLCDDIFRATALKSVGGWEGDSIRKGHTFVESRQTQLDDKKKSLFGIPFTK